MAVINSSIDKFKAIDRESVEMWIKIRYEDMV